MGVVRRERQAAPFLWLVVLGVMLLGGGGGGVVRGLEEGTAVYIVTMKQAAASHKRLDLERFGGSSVAAAGGGGGNGDTPATSVLRKPRCGPLLANISLIVLGLYGCVNFPLLQLAC
jgi:hypothetical protein